MVRRLSPVGKLAQVARGRGKWCWDAAPCEDSRKSRRWVSRGTTRNLQGRERSEVSGPACRGGNGDESLAQTLEETVTEDRGRRLGMQPAKHCRVEVESDTVILMPMSSLGELDCDLLASDMDGVLVCYSSSGLAIW